MKQYNFLYEGLFSKDPEEDKFNKMMEPLKKKAEKLKDFYFKGFRKKISQNRKKLDIGWFNFYFNKQGEFDDIFMTLERSDPIAFNTISYTIALLGIMCGLFGAVITFPIAMTYVKRKVKDEIKKAPKFENEDYRLSYAIMKYKIQVAEKFLSEMKKKLGNV